MRRLIFALCALLFFVAASEAATINARLSWTDNSNNETGFRVERKVGTGTYATLATVAQDVTSVDDPGLALGTLYCYRVFAFNALGDSAPSAEVCATSPDVPAPPSGLTIQVQVTVGVTVVKP